MKTAVFYLFVTLLLLIGLGLLVLTNKGVVTFRRSYVHSLTAGLATDGAPVVFEHANVVPMDVDGERVLTDQTVVVREGVITHVGDSAETEIPAGARVIDASGRYLMPGLVDMHVHVREANELLLFVANGVTAVRNMWGGEGALRWMGFPDHLHMRDEIESGRLLGPTLYTSGPIMEGPPARMPLMRVFSSPGTAVEAVARQKEQGYDFVKVYDNLELEVYQAILGAARDHRLQVVGHVPGQVGLDNALAGGQFTIEHLTGYIDPDAAELLVPEEQLPAYATRTREAGVWNCPTIGVYQMHVPDNQLHRLEGRPEMAYVSPASKLLWKYMSRPGAMGSITYQGDYVARINALYLHTTQVLHEGGARFILGTDTDNPYLVPGFSLLDELDYLVQAGFSPYEALETGTRNAAEALGRLDEAGTISPGKRADLILLEGNPLEAVSNVRQRAGVMVRGHWFTETELQGMLADLVASYRPAWWERLWPLGVVGAALGLVARRFRRRSARS